MSKASGVRTEPISAASLQSTHGNRNRLSCTAEVVSKNNTGRRSRLRRRTGAKSIAGPFATIYCVRNINDAARYGLYAGPICKNHDLGRKQSSSIEPLRALDCYYSFHSRDDLRTTCQLRRSDNRSVKEATPFRRGFAILIA